jgi:hypothetical protein
MSTLSELTPSGGSGKGAKFVASGALSNGSTVVLKSDGKVEIIAESAITQSIPAGSIATFNSVAVSFLSLTFLTSDKFVLAYKISTGSKAIVGTVSGSSITFGTEYTFNSSTSYGISISKDESTSDTFVIFYRDAGNSYYGTAIAGTVSGTVITFGTATVFVSASADYISSDSSSSGSIVMCWNSTFGVGDSKLVTVSGTTITLGSTYAFKSSGFGQITSVSFIDATRFVVAYSASSSGRAKVGQVSGTTLAYGTEVTFHSTGWLSNGHISYLGNSTDVIIEFKDDTTGYGKAIVGTVSSGTTISFGSSYNYYSSSSSSHAFGFADGNQKCVLFYPGPSYGKIIVATASGTTLSFGTAVSINSVSTEYIGAAFTDAGKFVAAYKDNTNADGEALGGQVSATSTNLTSTNFLGISDKAYADTATATVTLKGGISTNQSSLTVGSDYYVQGNGTLSTTTSSVKAGKAMNATTLKLTGE